MTTMPAAVRELLEAIDYLEDLLDRHAVAAIPGSTRFRVSDANWFSGQLRLAAARRQAAQELAIDDARALVGILELRDQQTPIDPIHLTHARELAASVARRAAPTE